MANSKAGTRKNNPVNPQNLYQRDKDFLSLDTPTAMKKYKVDKQAVYDRRFAINKKLKQAGLTVEQVLDGTTPTPAPASDEPKAKRTYTKRAQNKPAEPQAQENETNSRELMLVQKQIPVIMKPIEISFETFSIKLNGVPKKISVNPETNAIEIDL